MPLDATPLPTPSGVASPAVSAPTTQSEVLSAWIDLLLVLGRLNAAERSEVAYLGRRLASQGNLSPSQRDWLEAMVGLRT